MSEQFNMLDREVRLMTRIESLFSTVSDKNLDRSAVVRLISTAISMIEDVNTQVGDRKIEVFRESERLIRSYILSVDDHKIKIDLRPMLDINNNQIIAYFLFLDPDSDSYAISIYNEVLDDYELKRGVN